MALVEVIKWNAPNELVMWKFPSDALTTSSQVIVNESQEAIFFVDGKRADTLGPGRHTLQTANLPILRSLVGLAFGGASPFAAEVWFVQKTVALDIPWGTTSPLLLEDPQYGVVVPVRVHGQFGLEVSDGGKFLTRLAGTMSGFSRRALGEHFRGVLVAQLKSAVARLLVDEKVPILEVETQLVTFSKRVEAALQSEFEEFGLRVVAFRIMGVQVPENDPSVVALKQAKATMARRKIEGVSTSQDRQYELLRTMAGNEGPNTAVIMGQLGSPFRDIAGGIGPYVSGSQFMPPSMATSIPPQIVPPFTASIWFAHVNGCSTGPFDLSGLQRAVASGHLTPATFVWRSPLAAWMQAGSLPELSCLFSVGTPVAPPPFSGEGGN